MDNPSALVRILAPRVPLLLKTAAFHTLSLSPTSSKWPLKTELAISVIRSIMLESTPIGLQQKRSMTVGPLKGKIWISNVTMPKPEEGDMKDAVVRAVEELKDLGDEVEKRFEVDVEGLEVRDVEAEWTGYRKGAGKEEGLPVELGEKERYEKMMEEVGSEVTVLYFHGGALYLCDPCTHRQITKELAKRTSGRCLSVRYRLAPQHIFPSALLDCLLSYLYLLSPPPGSFHTPVPASKIVFAGDSAGGNLIFSLLQLLLQLHRSSPPDQTPTIRFHGKDVPVPLPAGVAANSGWFDLTRSLPSISNNTKYDYLPAPRSSVRTAFQPDDVWPTTPPRGDLYTTLAGLCHPLTSPLAAKDWSGAPPMWFCVGEEMLQDEVLTLARKAKSQGVKTEVEWYEAMPHVFAMMFMDMKNSGRCLDAWAGFMRRVTGEEKGEGEGARERCAFVDVEGRESGRVLEKAGLEWEDAVGMMREARARRLEGDEKEGKSLPRL